MLGLETEKIVSLGEECSKKQIFWTEWIPLSQSDRARKRTAKRAIRARKSILEEPLPWGTKEVELKEEKLKWTIMPPLPRMAAHSLQAPVLPYQYQVAFLEDLSQDPPSQVEQRARFINHQEGWEEVIVLELPRHEQIRAKKEIVPGRIMGVVSRPGQEVKMIPADDRYPRMAKIFEAYLDLKRRTG